MPRPLPLPSLSRGALAALAALGWLAAAPAADAGPIATLTLAPESALVPEAGAPAPLTGTIVLELGALPLAGTTTLELLDVAITGGGLSVALDPSVPSAGLGVVYDDGSFLIPTLFLVVDDGANLYDLAIPDLTGFLDASDLALLRLETSFEVDTLGPSGVVTAQIVAVPEPGSMALAGLALTVLAAGRRARQEADRVGQEIPR